MSEFIAILRDASPTVQALAVSAGGLIGVFLTLTVFFGLIWAADRWGTREPPRQTKS